MENSVNEFKSTTLKIRSLGNIHNNVDPLRPCISIFRYLISSGAKISEDLQMNQVEYGCISPVYSIGRWVGAVYFHSYLIQ